MANPIPPPLTDTELAEWVSNEVREYELRALERLQSAKDKAWADKDAEKGARARAIIAGQQAIRRDLPHLALSGGFTAAPWPEGGWAVRYSVHRADSFGTVPLGVVECVVNADGYVFVRKSPDVMTPEQLRSKAALPDVVSAPARGNAQSRARKVCPSASIAADAAALVACAETEADGGSNKVDSRMTHGVHSSSAT